jgi:hypothetical protein
MLVIPTGYFAVSAKAQLLPSVPSSPSIPSKTPPATKVVSPTAKSHSSGFKMDVILFGIDNKTGNVVTFASAKNQTAAVSVNASDENIKHENSTGVAEVFLTIPNATLKVGDKFQACNVSIKDLNLVCNTGFKSPLNKTETVNLLITGTSPSISNKTAK